jgi:hypothetical protein
MNEPTTDFPNLMALWRRHRHETRPIGQIVSEARAGTLPGVRPLGRGFGFEVVDEAPAITAMRKRHS